MDRHPRKTAGSVIAQKKKKKKTSQIVLRTDIMSAEIAGPEYGKTSLRLNWNQSLKGDSGCGQL